MERPFLSFFLFFFLNILQFVFQRVSNRKREREGSRLKNKWKRNIRNFSFLFQIKFRPDLEREGNVNKHLAHLQVSEENCFPETSNTSRQFHFWNVASNSMNSNVQKMKREREREREDVVRIPSRFHEFTTAFPINHKS